MQTRVGGGSGAEECVARGLEQTSLCGLAKGPLSAILESQDTGNCRSNGNTTEIDNEPSQLHAPQAVGESGSNRGAYQASNGYSQDQSGNSCTAKEHGDPGHRIPGPKAR